MRPPQRRHSLFYDFALFIGVIIIIVSGYFIHSINNIQSQLIIKQLANQSEQVEKYFVERIVYTGSVLGYMGHQIRQRSSDGNPDLVYIDQLFQAFSADPTIQAVLSSTIIGWVDTRYQTLVDGTYRIMKEPKDLSSRDYLHETVKNPWVMKLGQPIIGSTSGKWIIPAGIGVTDNNGQWIGSLVIGFQQSFMQQNFKKILKSPNMTIALMDLAGQVLVESPNYFISNNIPLADKVRKIFSSPQEATPLESKVPYYHVGYFGWGISYYYYKIPNYDYIIFISLNNPITFTDVWRLIFKYTPEITALFLFFILGAWFLKKRIIQPIIILSDAASAISQGNIGTAIPKQLNRESQNLANALEKVKKLIVKERLFQKELSLAHEQVKKANESLEQRVAERTQSLQQALNTREDFFNHIGHEIRTPVSSIYARTALLLEMWIKFDKKALKESIEDIQQNSLRVCDLVTSLLDLSKSRAGKLTYDIKQHDIVDIIQQVTEECRPLYERKSLSLVVSNIAENTNASCDAMRIGQVVRNLLSNACRYTAKGGVVVSISTTEMACDDGSMLPGILVAVRDSGIGIPEGEFSKIFEVFTQSSKTNAKAGGTGLGLAICREIITAHHGHIWAENNVGQAGSTFKFVIPLRSLGKGEIKENTNNTL